MNMNECKKRLKEVESTMIAINVLYIQLEIEKNYLQGCVKNPSLDNLRIIENYYLQQQKFIESII